MWLATFLRDALICRQISPAFRQSNCSNGLIEDTQRDPFGGIGKPEPLKNELSGWWSRRIDDEHRLVYKVDGDRLIIAKARGHY